MTEKQRILIVDDDENIAELISLYLMKEFYETKIMDWRKEDFEREKEKRTGEPKRKANCSVDRKSVV